MIESRAQRGSESPMSEEGNRNSLASNDPEFRPELAFPRLTEEMVERLRPYGREETLPKDLLLFTPGDRQVDMFVVLDGEIAISLPAADGGTKIIAHHRRFDFSGELNLLNSQGSLVEARTVTESRILRIGRSELRRVMRAEGDIANLITQATIWRRIGILGETTGGIVLLGHAGDAETTELQRFLIRNSYPYRIVEEPQEEASLLDDGLSDVQPSLPAVVLSDGRTLYRPTIAELADELGITELPDPGMIYDVTVVGAGPAGLAAAVYAASEGLCTIVIEGTAPGGQAGTSSKIENYLGFPTGISGQRLASRAQLQALKFGVRFAVSREALTLEPYSDVHKITLAGGISLCSRAVVIATGAQYRKLPLENFEKFENQGIYYAATGMETAYCHDKEVVVVGGGNSAGQAALFLAQTAARVNIMVRGK